MPTNVDQNRRRLPRWFWGVLLLLVIGWAGSGLVIYLSLNCWEQRGQFGDMFGFINALFSGVALLGVVYSIRVQMRQLRESNLLQVLQKMFHDYGSAEMLLAVKELHDLRRRNSDDKEMINEYNEKYETDYAAIKTLKPVEQLEQAQGTLHHRRRIVMDFYLFLAAVNRSGVVEDPAVLRTFRSSVDVEILPNILIPLMKGFTEYLGTASSGKPHDTVQSLEELHKAWAQKT